MFEGEKPIFTDPSKYLEDAKWYRLDESFVVPDMWTEIKQALLNGTMESISEISEDIGFLTKLRSKETDIDALGSIAKLIDLNLTMIKGLQDELQSQRKAYQLD
jgi:hypothetical protein